MSWTFPRLAGLGGLAGSLLTIVALLKGAAAPDTGIPTTPIYGAGAILLAVSVYGLFKASASRLGLIGKAGLSAALIALIWIAGFAILDISFGKILAPLEWLWITMVVAFLLLVGGLAGYAANALAVKALPAWAGLPLVIAGAMLLLDLVVSGALSAVTGGILSVEVNSAQTIITQLALALAIAACGAAGLALMLRSDMEWGSLRVSTSATRSVSGPST